MQFYVHIPIDSTTDYVPDAGPDNYGQVRIQSGLIDGVDDILLVCMRDSLGNYIWKTVTVT